MARPDYVPKLLQRAVAEHDRGNLAEAGRICERILKQQRRNFDAAHLLGVIRRKEGDPVRAAQLLDLAAKQAPTGTAAANIFWFNYGSALAATGRYQDAIASFDRVTNVTGQQAADVAYNRGNALAQLRHHAEAVASYRAALKSDPRSADAHYQLGRSLYLLGERRAAIASLEECIAIAPQLDAQLFHCLAELPILYESEAEIAECRTAYARKLEWVAANTHGPLARLAATPFYLAYQGRNDRELQQLFAKLLCRLVAQNNASRIAEPAAPGERILIGIVSAHVYAHTIWRLITRGWLTQLDRTRFQVSCYMVSGIDDAETNHARGICGIRDERFVAGARTIPAWRDTILADRPHVLLYPEVGMDPTTMHLAALRLAHVQCASWGHPVTTGLPTMDYFLTADGMEPPDGDAHYTEKLVRLPNLSIYYEPVVVAAALTAREAIGLRPDACVYWCGQSLYKYLPQHDQVFARIARQVPGSQFVFIDLLNTHRAKFRGRLELAFAAEGLRAEEHCVILDRLSAEQFSSVLGLSDVYLDSIGWSGGNTTLESLEHGLPIVTIAGEFMRGRHTLAIAQQMGLDEAVVRSIDDYIALAVRLGNNPEERAAMHAKITDRKARVYRDVSAIRALEDFLEHVARAKA